MKQEQRSRKFNFLRFSFLRFVIASIFVHITLICLLLITSHFESKNKPELIEIAFVDSDSAQNLLINPTTIAESDSPNANNELSEKARFLSEKNNTVQKETKAKTGVKFLNTAKSSQTMQKQLEAKTKAHLEKSKLFDNSFDAYSSLNKKESKTQKFQPGTGASQGSTTNDNLKNIESDLMTRLNTKEYRYFGYYSRIKSQLNQWWVPKVQQKFTKMLRQGRTIASAENKITKLVIILNDTGHLVKVQVMAESGIKDLDDAAIEAFRSAAPFPNPPKGMIDDDGFVKIRWDCVVES